MFRISTLITILLFGMIGANAAILTVTTTTDEGAGSLRQALLDATANGEKNDIVFAIPTTDPGYDLGANRFTILLARTLPTIPASATNITNSQLEAITVRGNDTFRILDLVNGAEVVISNITISHGSAGGDGGGIYMGDGATLTLNNCTISNNSAVTRGGGIYMNDSATLHVHGTTFASNTAENGGAIFSFLTATVNMDTSTMRGNYADDSGGGIFVAAAGTFNATNNTFSGNSAGINGGAIHNEATITLTSNTITGNSSGSGGGITNFGGTATLKNNLIALNTAGIGSDLAGGNPYAGTYNLIGNSDGCVGMNSATNLWGTTAIPLDPRLGALKNNGGPTFTHALLVDSPALDKGNGPGLTTDQRGNPRPSDSGIIVNAADGSDIGAYELQFAPPAAGVSIGGQIVVANGKEVSGIANATIIVTGPSGDSWTAQSNPFGNFEVADVPAGATYIISVTHRRYTFDTQTVDVTDNVKGLVFFAIQLNVAPRVEQGVILRRR